MDKQQLVALAITLAGVFAARIVETKLRDFFRRRFAPKVTPWLFRPVDLALLPAEHRQHCEDHTEAFKALGFALLGDYVLRDEPETVYARYFLHEDGLTLGEINSYGKTRTLSCISLAADATYFETASVDSVPPLPANIPARFIAVPGCDVAAINARHREACTTHATLAGTELVEVDDQEWREVVKYGQRLTTRALHQQGYLPDLPPFARSVSDESPSVDDRGGRRAETDRG